MYYEALDDFFAPADKNPLSEEEEELYEALAMLGCPWYLGTGSCSNGCYEEPACQTSEPEGGWIKQAHDASEHLKSNRKT